VHGTTKVTDDGSVAAASEGVVGDDLTAQVIDKAQEQIQAAKEATAEILELSGIPVENPIKLPEMEGDGKYKASDRPLNSEERSGAWLLGGLLGGVLLLGSLGGKKKAKKEEPKEEVKQEAKKD
jgi:hypothetical protein